MIAGTDGLPAVSLLRRVTVTSVVVLALMIVVVAVVADVVFAAQTRSELGNLVTARAAQAEQLVRQGLAPQAVVRRTSAGGGIDVQLHTADGRVYATAPDLGAATAGGPAQGAVRSVTRPLPDGGTITVAADPTLASNAERRLRRVLLAVGLGAIAVATAVVLATTRLALAPLDAMTSLARSISAGRRGGRLAPRRRDTDLGRTAAAFDEMLDALEGAEAHARTSEASTRRFVADAAHELRTPLAGIAATAEATARPGLPDTDRERLVILLVRDARRAGRLVDDLLTLARLDAGLELEPSEVDLLELARAEVDRMTVLDTDHGYRVDGSPVLAVADPEAVGQALTNLLANARRYTPAGGTVTVAVRARPGGGEIGVHDEGPGIAPEDRERIFDRMVRLDDARVVDAGSGAGGAGLGLAIARGAARAHGGDLRCVEPPPAADCRSPGAHFVLFLPSGRGPGARP